MYTLERCGYLRSEVFGGVDTSLKAMKVSEPQKTGSVSTTRLQYGIDTILELIYISAWLLSWLGRLTNSLTIFEDPFKASLWTLDESLLEDLDFEEVFEVVLG